ncbi:meiosis regulator and mRNA stability factor 1 isoform X1 [Onthophagus taurus]|uniref:meiosis regulator and mRNA stability factor 1 isoform X1 n=1 Tax=Onthophagus taurus TaxID=166361 RepID=UPI0039BDB723
MDSKPQHQTTDTDETSSDLGGIRPSFRFPPAPRLCKCANSITSRSVSYNSDSSVSDGTLLRTRRRNRRRYLKHLPPIGVFWDIENCQVPKNKSASSIVQKIRELFFDGYREAEFIVVCDVKKENAQIIQDLHDAQVNLIHVSSTSKNAADEKLRQSLRRYAETYSAPSAVVLISGDINFAGDLSDLRYRKKIQVILIHNCNAADALISCANKSYAYGSLTENLPLLKTKISSQYEILIENLPINCGMKKLRNRLNRLSDNCGGKVINVDIKLGAAVLVFSNYNFAIRAQRRLRGEDVYGYKIRLSNPTNVGDLPARNFTPRPPKSVEGAGQSSGYCSQDGGNYYPNSQNNSWDSRKYLQEQDTAKNLPYIPQDNFFVPIKSSNSLQITQQRSSTPMDDSMGACGVSYPNRSRSNSAFALKEEENATYQANIGYKTIELLITNLDPSLNLKSVLQNLIKDYVMVVGLNITYMKDTPIASVKVASHQDAQYLISKLHRYKLGNRRIIFSYVQSDNIDPAYLRDRVISVLTEFPGNRLPLYHLITLLQSRFNIKVSKYELNRLKDTVRIEDINSERIISLIPEMRSSPTVEINTLLLAYCNVHCPNGFFNEHWYGSQNYTLPNINMPLQTFSNKLHTLLTLHMDILPLLSFPICYESIFGEEIPTDENGVPLEHLVTCVEGVSLNFGGPRRNVKYLKRSNQNIDSHVVKNEDETIGSDTMSEESNANFRILSREIFEILSMTKNYQLNLSKFIPLYHNHYRRQCKLAYYGFTKLIDLLQCPYLSKVIQIMGDGDNRVITLTHSAQIRRFTRDLFKVLKAHQRKPITLNEFPSIYERAIKRPFNVFEYGLCELEDLLNEVPKGVIVVSKENPDETVTISIPKPIQTAEQVIRTKQFAENVIKLLYHTPQGSMMFNKFVPAYHWHFGHQCRISDYGFTKLIDLFDAIPETVRIEDLPNDERKISLTAPVALRILGLKIRNIIQTSKLATVPLVDLPSTYLKQYGYPLLPQTYDCETILEVLQKLTDYVDVSISSAGPMLILASAELNATAIMRIWSILLQPPHQLTANEFINRYQENFHTYTYLTQLEDLKEIVSIQGDDNNDNKTVQLNAFYELAAEFYHLLYKAGGKIRLGQLEIRHKQVYNKTICYETFDSDGLEDLLGKMDFAFVVQWPAGRTYVSLKLSLSAYGIPLPVHCDTITETSENQGGIVWPPVPPLSMWNHGLSLCEPAKPDTPPANPGNVYSPKTSPMFSIHLPIFNTPSKAITTWRSILSPMPNLQPVYTYPGISSPHPAEVPMPNKLLEKDDSNDSGVINQSKSNSETDSSTEKEKQTGTKPKILSTGKKSQLKFE